MGELFDKEAAIKELKYQGRLTATFQKAIPGSFDVLSPKSLDYNCVAWAACDDKRWWDPIKDPDNPCCYWPEGAPETQELSSYIKALELEGFELCNSDEEEIGYIKIALYAIQQRFVHAARREGGRWLSKLGILYDIEHKEADFFEPSCQFYGNPKVFMRRPIESQK